MNTKLSIITLVGLAFGVTSCSTVKLNTAKTMDATGSLLQIPVVAELDVASKKETLIENNIDKDQKLEVLKNNAVAELLKRSDADVLIEPRFEVEYKGCRKIKSLMVTGFPAKYKNFRSFVPADTTALKAELMLTGTYPTQQSVCIRPNGFAPHINPLKQSDTKLRVGRTVSKNTPWFIAAEGVYNYSLKNEGNIYSTLVTFGYSFSPYLGLGAGLGWQQSSYEDYYRYYYYDETQNTMPLFLNLRGNITNGDIAPYWSVNVGGNLFSDSEYTYIADFTLGVNIYGALVGFNYSAAENGMGISVGYQF